KAFDQLPAKLRENWLWIPLPDPPPRCIGLDRMIEKDLPDDAWHTESETRRLLAQMSPSNAFKLEQSTVLAQAKRSPVYGCGYRRTRNEHGKKVQRFEVRFDGLAGCLRTPGGGSSRQFVLSVEPDRLRTRLLAAREAARLMGIPDSYILPVRYNEAYHLCGDGVVVDAVKWLSSTVLEPMIQNKRETHGTNKRHTLSAIT
ncbi:MAG: DNA cytosine methyltransferase, partial [Mariprofundaceae bacterium]|nr:DNA cytosine methyltransferase [Mariprofundaceae bacterium]